MSVRLDSSAAAAAAPAQDADRADVQPYDILADRQETQRKLAHSPEVEALTEQIDIGDLNTIVTFGSRAAEEISKASDVVLRSMSMSELDDSGKMMGALARIMEQFDPDEVSGDTGLLGRLFGNARKQLDRVVAKYHTMGDEVDRIYVQLRQYETEITRNNRMLEDMFRANVGYFHELEKYIVAGDQGCQEIRDYLAQLETRFRETGDQSLTFEIQTLKPALQMLEQRTMDLRLAETVALQSIPMIKTIQYSNMSLVRKINSAFIVTLPVFKQALAQAIMLKRQKIQADAVSALDDRTNEMLIRNARNTAEQAKATARMVNGSSVRTDTLVTTWHTIMDGLEETRKISADARAQRQRDQVRLENIKKDFLEHGSAPK